MSGPKQRLTLEDLERLYSQLADAIDQVGEDKEALFLSKLALILARELGDPKKLAEVIDAARQDLD